MKYYFIKFFICFVTFLFIFIMCNINANCYYFVKKNIYGDNISFSYFKNIYNRYLGGIFPISSISNRSSYVFSNSISYSDYSLYKDGVKLIVGYNYLIPSLRGGIVVYIGYKENYNNVVIIEDNYGRDIWYGNLCNVNVRLYDNIDEGIYIGDNCNDYMYLVYSKENIFLDSSDLLIIN